MRQLVISILAVLAITTAALSQGALASPATRVGSEVRHASGIVLLAARPASQQLVEPLAKAWNDALWLARSNPDAMGYPWADAVSGQLVLSVKAPAAEALVRAFLAGSARTAGAKGGVGLPAPAVPVRTRVVDRSLGELEQIKNDATTLLAAGVPDAAAIYQTEPDFENNRVIITVERQSDVLFAALAARYGTQAVAIRVDPDRPKVKGVGRGDDSPPFYGAAKIQSPNGPCSSAFAWYISSSSTYAMLTAGHCAYNGGTVYNGNSSYTMGSVTQSSEENWNSGTGTVYFTGQSVYRGDLALIRISGYGTGSAAYIYSGSDNTTTSMVREKWYRSPSSGDQYCTSGYASLVICGWTVSSVGINVQDSNTGEWWRNVTSGYRNGSTGLSSGDSGGAVYTVRTDNGIAAKGIINAAGPGISTQWSYFTDIWDAYYGLPGDLLIQ